MNAKRRIIAGVGLAGMAATAAVVAPVLTAPALASSCSHAHPDRDTTVGSFIGTFVNIRRGPHNPPGLTCTSDGQGQLNQGAAYFCWDIGDTVSGTSTWTYVRNTATGVQGWVHDSLLSGFGSNFRC
jgi:hypothetical protein